MLMPGLHKLCDLHFNVLYMVEISTNIYLQALNVLTEVIDNTVTQRFFLTHINACVVDSTALTVFTLTRCTCVCLSHVMS